MKFMLIFTIKLETTGWDDAIARSRKTGSQLPKGAKLLGRWAVASLQPTR